MNGAIVWGEVDWIRVCRFYCLIKLVVRLWKNELFAQTLTTAGTTMEPIMHLWKKASRVEIGQFEYSQTIINCSQFRADFFLPREMRETRNERNKPVAFPPRSRTMRWNLISGRSFSAASRHTLAVSPSSTTYTDWASENLTGSRNKETPSTISLPRHVIIIWGFSLYIYHYQWCRFWQCYAGYWQGYRWKKLWFWRTLFVLVRCRPL